MTTMEAVSYTYADTATGGVDRRNNVKDLTTWRPAGGAADAYVSLLRFTADFAAYTARNLVPSKRDPERLHPSVSGYTGDARALFLPYDLDHEADPSLALEDARRLLRVWQARFDLDLMAIRCAFSGQKGFALELPASLFGGFEPGPCGPLAARLKALALSLAAVAGAEITTLDTAIYEPLRLWRVPNSRHGESDLYKIPLTAAEVLTLDLDAIRELARTPRDLAWPDDDEWAVVPALVDLWRATAETTDERRNGHRITATNGAGVAATLRGLPEGKRNTAIFRMASNMRGADVPQEWAERLTLEAATACNPPLPEAEAIEIVRGAYDRYQPTPERMRVNSVDPVSSLPPAAPFPVDVLPPASRRLVIEGAASLQAPPELVGVPHLAYTAAIMGNRYRLRVKTGWEEWAILWAGVVAVPGSAKSPAERIARRPLMVLQREAAARFEDALAEHERELAEWASAEKGERGPKPKRPVMESYYTTDATMEALAPMLVRAPGVALIRDELVGFVQSFDAYRGGKGGDRARWLGLWGGDPQKIDRKGADPIIVDDPAISLIGGVQPDTLALLQEEAGRRDGFCERFLLAYPVTRPARWTDAIVSDATIEAVTAVYRQLRASSPALPVQFHPKARALFIGWVNDNADLQERARGLLAGICAKLPAYAARLTLILHGLTHPVGPAAELVSVETVAGALALVEYFRNHAGRTLPHFGAAAIVQDNTAVRVHRILQDVPGEWQPRATVHGALGGHVSAEALDTALETLETLGLAEQRSRPAGDKGGRPFQEARAPIRESTESTELTPRNAPAGGVNSVDSVDSHEAACADCGQIVAMGGECPDCGAATCSECGRSPLPGRPWCATHLADAVVTGRAAP